MKTAWPLLRCLNCLTSQCCRWFPWGSTDRRLTSERGLTRWQAEGTRPLDSGVSSESGVARKQHKQAVIQRRAPCHASILRVEKYFNWGETWQNQTNKTSAAVPPQKIAVMFSYSVLVLRRITNGLPQTQNGLCLLLQQSGEFWVNNLSQKSVYIKRFDFSLDATCA